MLIGHQSPSSRSSKTLSFYKLYNQSFEVRLWLMYLFNYTLNLKTGLWVWEVKLDYECCDCLKFKLKEFFSDFIYQLLFTSWTIFKIERKELNYQMNAKKFIKHVEHFFQNHLSLSCSCRFKINGSKYF